MSEAPSGAAERLAYLLTLVASGPPRFALSELAERAGLPQSSVHRLLKVMLRFGLVERGSGQAYRPGRELHRMASQLVSRFDLVRSAKPMLQELVENWHETAVLCTYSPLSKMAIIADVVHTPNPLRYAVERGGEIALPWGSLGRAVLAYLPRGEQEAIIRQSHTGPLTGRPRSVRSELEADLAAIRKNKVSRYYDPLIDIAGIAGPIFGAEGEILGCIGVTMPSKRYQVHLEDDLAIAVSKVATELSDQAAILQS